MFVSTIPLYFKECLLKNLFEIIFTIRTRGGTRTHNPEGHGFLDRCVYLIPPLAHMFKERLAGRQGLEP